MSYYSNNAVLSEKSIKCDNIFLHVKKRGAIIRGGQNLEGIGHMNFKKMFINFRKKGYSGIIPFAYKGKEIHK